MGTFRLRAVRRDWRGVDIDFACHGDRGLASRFALEVTTRSQWASAGSSAATRR